ncbi:MAG: porin [Gammaproteobacteria bacterium]
MPLPLPVRPLKHAALIGALTFPSIEVEAADQALLDILLGNGVITQEQYDGLMKKESLTSKDILGDAAPAASAPASAPALDAVVEAKVDAAVERAVDKHLDAAAEERVVEKVAKKVESEFPVKASYGSKGFQLATRDGRFQTNLQWRAQLRYTNPFTGDPRQLAAFQSEEQSTFEARRLRMKIGGHGFQPWLKYYFEVDLEPTREVDDESETASGRVIDWRIDVAKFPFAELRVGQWKIDHNRERVDSSGRQQFVERSIVNRTFTIDRQVGVQLRGHLFAGTPADLRYWAGVFTGEGRGVENDDENMMWQGRLQWNFFGRDLDWKQTDVEYTELPTGSLAFGAMTNKGRCTRWSSSGCGNLDGFANPATAMDAQFKTEQMVQEFAFKWRGFSLQEEYHWKTVEDRLAGQSFDMQGAYAQAGYFFHHLFPMVPAPLELAFRYAFVDEPNRFNRFLDNNREEYSMAANWFFSGHDNKLTLDYSHLTLDEAFLARDVSDDRVRVQWDVSF